MDDFLRFIFLSNIFMNLAPLWGLDTPFYERCPRIHDWLFRMQSRNSCPYNDRGGHSREHFLVAFGDKYKKVLFNRYFASHAIGLERDLTLEPSGMSREKHLPSIRNPYFMSSVKVCWLIGVNTKSSLLW